MAKFPTPAIALAILVMGCGAVAADPEGGKEGDIGVGTQPTQAAFTASDADAALVVFNKAFYVVENGKGYFKEDTNGDRNHFWTQAEEIEMLLDGWDRTQSPDLRRQIEESIAGFV